MNADDFFGNTGSGKPVVPKLSIDTNSSSTLDILKQLATVRNDELMARAEEGSLSERRLDIRPVFYQGGGLDSSHQSISQYDVNSDGEEIDDPFADVIDLKYDFD